VLVIEGDANRRIADILFKEKFDAWNLLLKAFYDGNYFLFPIKVDLILPQFKESKGQL